MGKALYIGLSGGIGSGKSTAARVLVECGAHLVDTDAIARALTQAGGAAIAPIAAAFGATAIDPNGALDRERMRAVVFADASAKLLLEGILHPLIGQVAMAQTTVAAGGQPIVFDIPLLAESRHWRDRVQRILVIDCSERMQIDRVSARPGWTRAAAERVIAQQAARASRRAIADAVIYNQSLTLDALGEEVRSLFRWWTAAWPAALPTAVRP